MYYYIPALGEILILVPVCNNTRIFLLYCHSIIKMSFSVRASSAGSLGGSLAASQLVNAAQNPIYQPSENITVTTLTATTVNAPLVSSNSGTEVYQTLGTQKILHPPTNALSVGGVNVSVLNKRTRTSQAAAAACVSTMTSRSSGYNEEWGSVCWSPELGLFCAVAMSADGDDVMTSPDGINWTPQIVAEENRWWSVCWSPELGLFCAVSRSAEGNRSMTSPDGVNWTTSLTSTNSIWLSVCWAPELGLFCAVASSSGEGIYAMTSPDGVNWTPQSSAPSNNWWSVCWSAELRLFCAVAQTGTADRVMTSPDGANWTSRASVADNTWFSVCWSAELSLFCAVSVSGNTANGIMTSPDGVNWTARAAPTALGSAVCWSPQLGVFCVLQFFAPSILTSFDGINWTSRSSTGADWKFCCWSPELSVFCGVAKGGNVLLSAVGMPNSQSVLKTNPSYVTVTQTGNVGISTDTPTERLEVTGNILASGTITPFTGAHITPSVFSAKDIGKLVSSTGYVQDISINNAWPRTILSSTEKDPAVYGVISEIKDNRIALVNGVGEGAIWVCNRNGSIFKGDLLTSSSHPGYAQKQDDGSLHSYTAARAIMNCSFDETETKPVYGYHKIYTYRLEEAGSIEDFNRRSIENAAYYINLTKEDSTSIPTVKIQDSTGNNITLEDSEVTESSFSLSFPVTQVEGSSNTQTFTIEDYLDKQDLFVILLEVTKYWKIQEDQTGQPLTVPAYTVKYIDKAGTDISAEKYRHLKSTDEEAYAAALIGCIYLCG